MSATSPSHERKSARPRLVVLLPLVLFLDWRCCSSSGSAPADPNKLPSALDRPDGAADRPAAGRRADDRRQAAARLGHREFKGAVTVLNIWASVVHFPAATRRRSSLKLARTSASGWWA